MTDAQRAAALARFDVLRPVLEDHVPLASLARELHVPLRTLQRWMARYRRAGLSGLAREPRADRGQSRLRPAVREAIEGLALQRPRRSPAAIQRQVASIARERGWVEPSYRQVHSVIRQLDPALVTLAHEGTRAYSERFDLLHRREASRPNEIWQADHTPLDIWILDEHGRAARPLLTIVIDDYSRVVAGYLIGFHAPSALWTALAFRQAIWRKGDPHWTACGIPDVFYTDHGSDFTSQHLEQVAADLNVRLSFSIPGRPRGRGKVERFFESVNQLLLCDLPGYAPAGSSARAKPVLALSELDARFRIWLLEEYHQKTHSETGVAPQARWESDGFLPRLPDSLEQLDLLLLTIARSRRVQRDGVHFKGFRYLDLTLAAYVGEDVVIRYDPRDLGEIRVFHQNKFVCRAICAELAGETIGLKDIIQARNRHRRALRHTLAERAAAVGELLGVKAAAPLYAESEQPVKCEPSSAAIAPRLKRYRDD
jgi:putative transposase